MGKGNPAPIGNPSGAASSRRQALALMLGALASLPRALAVPVSFLSGISPAADAPRVWSIQLAWLAGLLVASRWIFSVAVRKVTVQGG